MNYKKIYGLDIILGIVIFCASIFIKSKICIDSSLVNMWLNTLVFTPLILSLFSMGVIIAKKEHIFKESLFLDPIMILLLMLLCIAFLAKMLRFSSLVI